MRFFRKMGDRLNALIAQDGATYGACVGTTQLQPLFDEPNEATGLSIPPSGAAP